MVGRQAQRLDELAAARPLHRDHGERPVQVLDLDALGSVGLQAADHLAAVGGVGDQEHLVLTADVGDEVVDDATALVVAAQGVLRLPDADPAQVVRQPLVDDVDGARPAGPAAHDALAQVAHVEDPDGLAHRSVLLQDTAARVLDRHVPAAEVGQLGAERHVAVVQRSLGEPLVRRCRHAA